MSGKAKPDFLWGAATSSHQIEGGNLANDWWAWEQQGHIEGKVKSGIAVDHWNRFREDLRLTKELGLNAYRFSFEWSRFEPREGEWKEDAFAWYDAMISECEKLEIVPMATIHHFTLPKWCADQGGFAADETPQKLARFASKIAGCFGSRIPLWCTINEPMVLVNGCYIGEFMPPARRDWAKAMRAARGLLKSHLLIYDALKEGIQRREGPFKDRPLEIGFAHNMLDFMPLRRLNPGDRALAKTMDYIHNEWWLKSLEKHPTKFDFVGVNYYTKAYAEVFPKEAIQPNADLPADKHALMTVHFAAPNEERSDLGFALHPEGFRKVLRRAARLGKPLYVTENGIADAADKWRKEYLRSHLLVLAEEIRKGLDVRGYFHWSLMDNFEWIKGFMARFGLYEVDSVTLDRKLRPSGAYFREVVKAHESHLPPMPERIETVRSSP